MLHNWTGSDPNDTNSNGGGSGNGSGGGSPMAPMYPFGPPPGQDDDSFVPEDYLINYNKKFANSLPTLFRDAVIQQTISCLIGKFKPNALLIGAAGVGKTKIIEDIARRIASQDALIPDQLLGYTIWELPLSNIVAGSGIVGEVERKTKAILEFASNPDNKVILFIDEIHLLIGESQTYDKIAQIMKPALARGDMKVIGATTSQESQNLMNDPAFNRRFTRLIVDELSKEQTKEILHQMETTMFDHYNQQVAINDKVIEEVVNVADEFKTMGSHRPDNAITLLDRSMADALISRKVLENTAKINNDTAMLTALQSSGVIILSKAQMRNTAMKLMTGNNKKEATDIATLSMNLSDIKGQDDVIKYLVNAIRRDELNLFPRVVPFTILLAGESGVGKTETVKILAKTMTGLSPIILNMTEYHSSASVNRIIGAPPGYVGSDSKGELPFDILETNPYQIILLDEFEKADPAVQKLFMSAFDEGFIKTSKGKIVDFSKSIIIATTNAGYTTRGDAIGFTVNEEANENTATIADLSKFIPVELLNRFTKVLNFHPITEALFDEILKDTYARNVKRIKENKSSLQYLDDELSDEALKKLHKENFAKEFGARPVFKAVKQYIEDLVIEHEDQMSQKALPAQTSSDADTAENIA